MYNALKKLISKKFYKDGETAQNKIDVAFACNRITDDQYTALTALVAEVYGE